MRPIRAVVLACSLLACTANLDVPTGTMIACDPARPQCPSGYQCDPTVGLCLPTDLVVPTITVNGAVPHNGAQWVDTTAVTVSFALPVGAATPATVTFGGDVTAQTQSAYATPLSTTLTVGDGDKTLLITFADASGSFAPSVPLALHLDTATPTNTVIVSPPSIIAGEVTLPDVYVNADSISIPFASQPATQADDFDGYVFSTDGGATWNPTPAPLLLAPVAQDGDTIVWIRERNIFGKMTPNAQQGIVTIHEDSQPPTAPVALVPTVVANLTSEAGVMVQPSFDPGGGPVHYEVIGGSYTEFTPIGTRPLIRFNGVATGELAVYIVHGVDRAGNAGPALTIPVGDESMVATGIERSNPIRQDFWGGSGTGVFTVTEGGNSYVEMCPLDGSGSGGCGEYELPTTTSVIRSASIYQRNAVFEQFNSTKPIITLINVGPDGRLDFNANDDSAPANLDFGHCPVAGPGGIVYGKWLSTGVYEVALYRYGADGIANTGDSGEGTVIVSGAGRIQTGNPCWPQFNGRQIMWIDVRTAPANWVMYDLGPDRAFATADDIAEVVVSPTVAGPSTYDVTLGDSGLAVHSYRGRTVQWTDFGPDGAYDTGDDSTSTHVLDGLSQVAGMDMPAARDGKLLGYIDGTPVLYDLGARSVVNLHSSLIGDGTLGNINLGPAMIFGSLEIPTADITSPLVPAYFDFNGEPMSFRFDTGSSRGTPSGTWGGDFVVLEATRFDQHLLVSLAGGGVYFLGDTVQNDTSVDVSPEGLAVWGTGVATLFGAGPDKRIGSADDLGPVALPATGLRWPRVSAGRVVWASTTTWQAGATLTSTLSVLDLGADGWLSADDTPVTLTAAGTQAATPALAGTKLAYLDFSTASGGSGQCALAGRSGVDRTACKSIVVEIDLVTGTKTTLSSTAIYHEGLRVAADGRAVWLQDNGGSNDLHLWDGTTDHAMVTATTGSMPQLDGNRFAYFLSTGPVVIDAGADGAFATADDAIIRNGFGAGSAPIAGGVGAPTEPPYYQWLGSEGMLLGAGAMPVADDAQHYDGTSGVAIADGGTATDHVTITGLPNDLVQNMTIALSIAHAHPADLVVTLTSPIGDVVTLLQHPTGGVSNLSFDLTTLPALLNHWGEPIAGDWLLTITDVANGTGGTLASWSITHHP